MPREDGSDEVADLWAMAAELERQFAGYKQRLAERNNGSRRTHATAEDDDASGGDGEAEEEVTEPPGGGGDENDSCDVRGRMYEAYVRRRDERLRQGWRARMERKEAEVKAFWARLDRRAGGGNSGGGGSGPTTTTDAGTAAGDEDEGKTERNDDDKKKSSGGAALAPRRISGKKHARTRSFSSSTNTGRNNCPDDVERRRALSLEPPPPSEPQVAGKESRMSRARPADGAATPTTTTRATLRPKTSLRRKNSVKGHSSAKQTGPPKLPRSLPRRASSGGLEDLSKEVVLPSADNNAAAPPLRRSYEQDAHGEFPKASPPRPSTSVGARNAQTASPDSDRSEVVDAVPEAKPEAKNTDVKKHGDEVDASPADKLGNPHDGEITSDSDIEPNYVYINEDIIKEQSTSVPETRAASVVAVSDFSVKKKTNQDNAETMTPPAGGATATGIATTDARDEAPARESSGDSSFSDRLGRSPPGSATPSCSSRDQSIERVLEADAALLRKKRAEKSALMKTPGSAGSRVSGTARSPKETPKKGFKRFLSFGKKNRAREVTVIDCTSPSVLSSVADNDSGRWLSAAGSIKPRMGSSDAASDDTDHGLTTSPRVSAACSLQSLVAASPAKSELAEIVPQVKSPKAHRSFFSFRSLNCGRG